MELEFSRLGKTHDFSATPVQLVGVNWPAIHRTIVFQAILNKDVDGAPTAYGPLEKKPVLDSLDHATDSPGKTFPKAKDIPVDKRRQPKAYRTGRSDRHRPPDGGQDRTISGAAGEWLLHLYNSRSDR